ncbi:hypothetical protein [Streptomyces sp. ST1015]|uniref:hypothetical protein n=1 Tax=Streptomyces sp. ST1015 TaxID=1848900 RepID=UPI001CA6DFD3|nr:hypothetical protein [Streptomyces sp. ST1015]QZZ25467.1 hypothetical protein A7X85_03460 [Streptomyces sp. ST1015]
MPRRGGRRAAAPRLRAERPQEVVHVGPYIRVPQLLGQQARVPQHIFARNAAPACDEGALAGQVLRERPLIAASRPGRRTMTPAEQHLRLP